MMSISLVRASIAILFSMQCHYCQKKQNPGADTCDFCGMPTPLSTTKARQSQFSLWLIAIALFCLTMVLWLPRHIA